MASFRIYVARMLVFAVSALCISGATSQKVHVGILNKLGGGKSIGIHCQSKDNDLGPQTVADGAQYGWDFSVNVFGTTLFYCNMGWESVQSFPFSAYDYQRDKGRCSSNCSWLMAEEGIYSLNDGTGLWEFTYSWTS